MLRRQRRARQRIAKNQPQQNAQIGEEDEKKVTHPSVTIPPVAKKVAKIGNKTITVPTPPQPEPPAPPKFTPTVIPGTPGKIEVNVTKGPTPPRKVVTHSINLTTGE